MKMWNSISSRRSISTLLIKNAILRNMNWSMNNVKYMQRRFAFGKKDNQKIKRTRILSRDSIPRKHLNKKTSNSCRGIIHESLTIQDTDECVSRGKTSQREKKIHVELLSSGNDARKRKKNRGMSNGKIKDKRGKDRCCRVQAWTRISRRRLEMYLYSSSQPRALQHTKETNGRRQSRCNINANFYTYPYIHSGISTRARENKRRCDFRQGEKMIFFFHRVEIIKNEKHQINKKWRGWLITRRIERNKKRRGNLVRRAKKQKGIFFFFSMAKQHH